jgi:hypothetical protein
VSERGRRLSSPISPKTLVLGTGVASSAQEPFSIGPGAPAATAATVRGREGSHRVVRWYADVRSLGSETLRALLALDRGPGRRPGLPHVIRLSTPIAGPAEIEAADSQLRSFAGNLLAAIARLEERTHEQERRQAEIASTTEDAAPNQPR